MPPADAGLSFRHAVALGLLQGPTELLPVSSSAHTTLIPWLAGWPYAELDGQLRKSFEVSLHAGTALALAIVLRRELATAIGRGDRRRALVGMLALAPPALAGLALRGTIERRLGGPRSIAAGLLGGALAMALADRAPVGDSEGARGCGQAGPVDGLALGLAQASALVPGISRSGATLAAARARGFGRGASQRLCWTVALPVMLGASALELDGPLAREPALRTACLAGTVAAFASTLASTRALQLWRGGGRSLLPYSLYRCLLAGVVMTRTRRGQ